MSYSIWLCSKRIIFFSTSQIFQFSSKVCEKRECFLCLTVYYPPLYHLWPLYIFPFYKQFGTLLRKGMLYTITTQIYRARWLRGNARDSHSGGPGYKSLCRPTWLRFFRGFPQSSRQMLCWIFITTIHLAIIHQIHIS